MSSSSTTPAPAVVDLEKDFTEEDLPYSKAKPAVPHIPKDNSEKVFGFLTWPESTVDKWDKHGVFDLTCEHTNTLLATENRANGNAIRMIAEDDIKAKPNTSLWYVRDLPKSPQVNYMVEDIWIPSTGSSQATKELCHITLHCGANGNVTAETLAAHVVVGSLVQLKANSVLKGKEPNMTWYFVRKIVDFVSPKVQLTLIPFIGTDMEPKLLYHDEYILYQCGYSNIVSVIWHPTLAAQFIKTCEWVRFLELSEDDSSVTEESYCDGHTDLDIQTGLMSTFCVIFGMYQYLFQPKENRIASLRAHILADAKKRKDADERQTYANIGFSRLVGYKVGRANTTNRQVLKRSLENELNKLADNSEEKSALDKQYAESMKRRRSGAVTPVPVPTPAPRRRTTPASDQDEKKINKMKDSLAEKEKKWKKEKKELQKEISELKDQLVAAKEEVALAKAQAVIASKPGDELKEQKEKWNAKKKSILAENKLLQAENVKYQVSLAHYKARLETITNQVEQGPFHASTAIPAPSALRAPAGPLTPTTPSASSN